MRLRDWLKPLRFLKSLANGSSLREGSAETYVIGQEMAQAIAAQQRHDTKHGHLTSPLAGLRYADTEGRLWRWTESSVDSLIATAVARFATLDEAGRTAMRDSLSMDDLYTLLAYVRRCALSALRSGDPDKIETAFNAIAMIDLERIDWRDLLVATRMVRYAGQRQNLPVSSLINQAIGLADRQTAKALRRDGSRPVDLANSCGFLEVDTPEGIVLVQNGFERYAPKANLAGIAFEIARAIEANGYEPETIEIALDFPLVWLNCSEDPAMAGIVRAFTGCASVHGVPHGDPSPNSSGQFLLALVAEAASEEDARAVAVAAERAAGEGAPQIAVARGRLCAVIVQSSWLADTAPVEDLQSLERMRSFLKASLG